MLTERKNSEKVQVLNQNELSEEQKQKVQNQEMRMFDRINLNKFREPQILYFIKSGFDADLNRVIEFNSKKDATGIQYVISTYYFKPFATIAKEDKESFTNWGIREIRNNPKRICTGILEGLELQSAPREIENYLATKINSGSKIKISVVELPIDKLAVYYNPKLHEYRTTDYATYLQIDKA